MEPRAGRGRAGRGLKGGRAAAAREARTLRRLLTPEEFRAVAVLRILRDGGGTGMDATVESRTVKGFERFLTAEDLAELLQRPVRYVREALLVTRVIRATKTGGNSWRVDPDEFRRWKAAGCPTGSKFSAPSGGRRAARAARERKGGAA